MLAIRGAETDTFSRAGVQALRRRLPTAQVVEMPWVGHLVPLERPEEVAETIVRFLDDTIPA
jgi:pimeloyl-ACP methyl ester carboxylesterase